MSFVTMNETRGTPPTPGQLGTAVTVTVRSVLPPALLFFFAYVYPSGLYSRKTK